MEKTAPKFADTPGSGSIDALFRGSSLRSRNSLELGWKGFTIEKRKVERGERGEEVVQDHFIVLWADRPSFGARADQKGRFAPYAKHPDMISLGPPGILPAVRARTPSNVVVCTFDANFVEHFEEECELRSTIPLYERAGIEDRSLQQLLKILLIEADSGGSNGAIYAHSISCAIAIRFLSVARAEQPLEASKSIALPKHRLQRVLDRMHSELAGNVELAKLAADSGYSRAHFLRMFRATTGKTPHRYLTDLRLQQARHRLEHTSETLTEIALASGFSSHSHFAKVFHDYFGITPGMYRRENSIFLTVRS